MIAIVFLLTGFICGPNAAGADQDIEKIKTEISRFVQGMERKDMGLVLSIFKPGVSWAGYDLVSRIKAETSETFSLWKDIKIRIDKMKTRKEQGYRVTETTFNIKARVAADGSMVERNLIIRWLWEKTPQGWRVIGDNSLPGAEIPQARPSLSAGGGNGGMDTSIEVIGFGIKPGSKEEKQLQGVASAGGGRYVPAKNADELIDVLSRTVERTVRENTPAKTPPPPPPLPRSSGGSNSWESLKGTGGNGQSEPIGNTPQSSKGFQSLNKGSGNWQPLNDGRKQSDFLNEGKPRQNESGY